MSKSASKNKCYNHNANKFLYIILDGRDYWKDFNKKQRMVMCSKFHWEKNDTIEYDNTIVQRKLK
jgi:hypothetical protein